MQNHPEVMNKPLISPAIHTILIAQMRDELRFGKQTYPDGTISALSEQAEVFADVAKRAAVERELSWTHIALAEMYHALSQEDPSQLYIELSRVARTIVQWMENLNDTHGGTE